MGTRVAMPAYSTTERQIRMRNTGPGEEAGETVEGHHEQIVMSGRRSSAVVSPFRIDASSASLRSISVSRGLDLRLFVRDTGEGSLCSLAAGERAALLSPDCANARA